MATNQDILNLGFPAFPDPPLDPPGPSDEATRYGNALIGVQGTEASPTQYGDYLRRIPDVRTGQSVSSNAHTAADPGEITNVVATTASSTGTKKGKASGGADPGEVRIIYASSGVATLGFAAGDAVTACAYNIMVVPQEIVDFLDDTSDPP